MNDTLVIIPAFTQDTPPQRDLMRKLGGISLIQRAVTKGLNITEGNGACVFVLTDSELVALTSERAGAHTCFFTSTSNYTDVIGHWRSVTCAEQNFPNSDIVVLSPFAPLIKEATLSLAKRALHDTEASVISMTQKHVTTNPPPGRISFSSTFFRDSHNEALVGANAFTFFHASCLKSASIGDFSPSHIEGGDDLFEIRSYQDWWVCEKLLLRRRIIFRVIGNQRFGMGHIYRALSIAHDITDHEIIFVTDTEHQTAVAELTDHDYRVEVFDPQLIVQGIVDLEPDLVINDILDTSEGYINALQNLGIQVVNFEDLGSGASLANITFNELYDVPQISGGNLYWGSAYFFVRDEFADATPCHYRNPVGSLLLTFGGTDQHNLTQKLLNVIYTPCRENNIHISIVTGPGYSYYSELEQFVAQDPTISLTHATGVVSKIMEKIDIAITSNGRTVYEMAHMNIPAIVVPQHERERTHAFACEENGFIALEPYQSDITERAVLAKLEMLINKPNYRKTLFSRLEKFNFSQNKHRVIRMIEDLL